ncbi:MAG: hypothetical protein ACE5GA_02950, partial [Candidatus Zixiibacteriota bacterium]
MTESLTTFTGRFLDRALRIAPPAAMFIFFLAGSVVAAPSDKTLVVRDALRYPHVHSEKSDPTVSQRCFCPQLPEAGTSPLNLPRQSPWSLPQRTLAGGQKAALNVLVLRVDFQLESPDNPLTTGVGKMDFRSLQEFTAQYGHEIDPTPHDSAFYNQHMLSLADYYDFVSRGTLQLTWDIWPRGDALRSGDTLTYLLPRQMAYYGDTLLVEARLTEFFRDCVRVADSINPEIRFGDYQSIIIFHAGADRQNDVGFPATPFDLLTGFIRTEDTIWVDNDSTAITNGLFAPEQASQDNRATALNAVLAHEFGHQLGLVDLYSTRTGFTQIGDFALMDNNGFGVGIDFGFSGVFQTFGAFPVYMSAFSRAFLGFDSVVVLPRGTPLFLAAAELDTAANAPRIAKVPISDFEYFLLENRQQVIDTTPGAPFVVADPATGVIIGPARDLLNRIPSGEFDFLLPGNGILIYHVDESVAFGDADGDGVLNWRDNDLQWDPNRRFITLVEADGFIDLGGNFFKGFGGASDYWTPTGFNSLTPNTNPSTRSTTGAVTHIGIQIIDSTRFNHNISVSTQNSLLRSNYPIWGGSPRVDLNVIAAEIDSTPGEELIFASGSDLIVSAQDGSPGWQFASQLVKSLIRYADTVDFFIGYDSSVAPMTRVFPKNLFARLPGDIQSGPVFGTLDGQQIVAVAALDTVYAFGLLDSNPFDPRPDSVWKFATGAPALEVMFNGALFALTSSSVIRFDILNEPGTFSVIPGAALNWAAVGAGSVVVHSVSGNADQMSFVGRPGVTTR